MEGAGSCIDCGHNDGENCNVGTYYADKGKDNGVCYEGELWVSKEETINYRLLNDGEEVKYGDTGFNPESNTWSNINSGFIGVKYSFDWMPLIRRKIRSREE